MGYSEDELRKIFGTTKGYCVYCHKKLSFSNYADYDERGAWEVAHSVFPKRTWDTDNIHVPVIDLDISNLAPACPECNRGDQRGTVGPSRLMKWAVGGVKCPECRTPNPKDNKRCYKCGSKISWLP